MRVCMVTSSFPRYKGDSAGVFVYSLSKALAINGVRIRVVTPSDIKNNAKKENIGGIDIVRFEYFYPLRMQRLTYREGMPTNLKKSLFARIQLPFFLLSSVMKTFKVSKRYDVIHANWAINGLVGVMAGYLNRKPVVLTVRGSDIMLLKFGLAAEITKTVLRKVEIVITVSNELKKKIIGMGVKEEKVVVIPNGVETDIFRPRDKEYLRKKLGLPLDRKIILFIGSMIEIKGVKYLNDAIIKLCKKKKFYFVFIGEGNLRSNVERRIEKAGIKDDVLFAGFRAHDEIPYWLNASDLLVLPTLSEGRPNVVLEAMASEVPVIATKVGGIPELIEDGRTGFLIEPRDAEAIERKIIEVTQNKKRMVRVGREARKAIMRKCLSWERCAKQHIELYSKLLKG